jgi:4-amino-4-deoxy-L-arabinose transferase-like glycosyltransferase
MITPNWYAHGTRRFLSIFIPALCIVYIFGIALLFRLHRIESDRGMRASAQLPVYGSDSAGYVLIANNILEYGAFSYQDSEPYLPDSFRTPGYPALLAISKKVTGSFVPIIFLQILFVLGTCTLLYLMGRSLFGEVVGYGAAFLYLLDPTTIFHTLVYLSDISFAFLFLLATYLFFFWKPKKEFLVPLFSGLVLGASTLVRPISFYIPPVFLFFGFLFSFLKGWSKKVWLDFAKSAFLFLVAYSIVVAPWLVRNKIDFGVAQISSVQSFNLFFYNVPEFLSFTHGNSPDFYRAILQKDAGDLSNTDSVSLVHSAQLQSIALRYIKAEPFAYAKFHLIKMAPFYLSSGLKSFFVSYNDMVGQQIFHTNEGNITNLLAAGKIHAFLSELAVQPFVAFEQIFWVALLFLCSCSFFEKKNRSYFFLFVTLALYFGIATGPVAYARFRIPAEPFLLLLAGGGMLVLYKKIVGGSPRHFS